MASSVPDEEKLISLYDSPSSSQPLLHKPSSHHSTEESISNSNPPAVDSDQSQYLQIFYNHGHRPWKDLFYLVVFLLFVVLTFGFGIFVVANSNPNYYNLSSYKYDYKSGSCVSQVLFPQFAWPLNISSSSDSSRFLRSLIWVLVVTLILSLPICFLVLLCLKRYTKQVVYTFIPLVVAFIVFFNLYWFVACTVNQTCSTDFPLLYRILVLAFVFILIGVVVWIIVANWHRVELTIEIIGVASNALSKNLGLFIALPFMTLCLVVYYAPIVVFLVFAKQNGKIISIESNGTYSCEWKQDSWVSAYFALGVVTMLWSLSSLLEAHVYVISATVAQWYFTKDDTIPKKTIRSSLRNAFGPSSGTICASGLLIGVVRIVRSLIDNAREEAIPGIVNRALQCCVNSCLSAVEFFNKFTIIFAAITGEGYCTSARMTYDLLRRNLLSTAIVETISTRLLAGIVFVATAIYAVSTCAILNAVTDLGGGCYLIGIAGWAVLFVVMGYAVYVLDNVIEAVYICYSIDRDKGEVFKPEVHDVYVQLPIRRKHSSLSYDPLVV